MQTPHSWTGDTVSLCQHCFRALLQALARPCQPQELPGELAKESLPLPWELASIALTLCDQSSAVYLGSGLGSDDAHAWLRFYTGMNLVQSPCEADFVLVGTPCDLPLLASLKQGTATYPDRSATLVVAGTDFSAQPGILASGPGIRNTVPLPFRPADGFLAQWRDNHDRFPMGVDVFFCGRGQVAGLPRTTLLSA